MEPTITTRRNVMRGVGAASVVGLAGASSTVSATEHDENAEEDTESDDEHFAAVRVGNLVPDLAVERADGGPPSETPGQGPSSTPPGQRGPPAPTATELDLYVGKPPDRNPTIGEVSYPTFGPGAGDAYLQVPAREYAIAVARSGTIEPLIERQITVDPGKRYTALALGTVSTEGGHPLQSLIIEDAADRAEATPEEDWAEVSFVHASPNAGPVDIDVDGIGTVFEDVEFGDVSDYVGVPPHEYTVDISSGNETVLSLTRDLVAGTRLTVYVTGFAGADEFPDEDGRFGLSAVATIDGLNPQPRSVLTR